MCRWANKLDQYYKLKKDSTHNEEQKFNVRSANNEIINTIMQHWAIQASDARSITATGMKYMRKTAGNSWTDYKTNTDIAK
jgi:hypothetical protein